MSTRKVATKLSKRHTYIFPTTGGRGPDKEGRTSFTMRWWVEHGIGYDGKQSGWRGQCFFARMSEYIKKEGRKDAVILASEQAFEALQMEEVLDV